MIGSLHLLKLQKIRVTQGRTRRLGVKSTNIVRTKNDGNLFKIAKLAQNFGSLDGIREESEKILKTPSQKQKTNNSNNH